MVDQEKRRLSAESFVSGLFAALAEKGKNTISIKDTTFDEAVEEVFEKLCKKAGQQNIDVRFRIRRNRVHGDSSELRDAITHAAQRKVIGLDNPDFVRIRLRFGKGGATQFLNELPVEPEVFRQLADDFLEEYSQNVA